MRSPRSQLRMVSARICSSRSDRSSRRSRCRAQELHPHPAGPPEAELDQAARAVSTLAENSWLYSPAMARLTRGRWSRPYFYRSRIVCFVRFAGSLPLTIAAARVFHLIRLKRISRKEFLRPTAIHRRSSGIVSSHPTKETLPRIGILRPTTKRREQY